MHNPLAKLGLSIVASFLIKVLFFPSYGSIQIITWINITALAYVAQWFIADSSKFKEFKFIYNLIICLICFLFLICIVLYIIIDVKSNIDVFNTKIIEPSYKFLYFLFPNYALISLLVISSLNYALLIFSLYSLEREYSKRFKK